MPAKKAPTAAVEKAPKAVAAEGSAAPEAAAEKTAVVKKKRSKKSVPHAQVHILAGFNNTLVTVADNTGKVISWSSSGSCGFKGARKSTPYAAQVAAEKAMSNAESFGITEVDVFIKGVGAGRDQAVRGIISKGNVNVLSIIDKTPIAHGGVRKKKPRRV